jgi:glycosyltransferase involved in cell wall biosynthesis
VSVVVSAYNEERHIDRLIRSLQAQTMPAFEVIVIDDGSTDNTAARAEWAGASVLTVDHAGPAAGASGFRGDPRFHRR